MKEVLVFGLGYNGQVFQVPNDLKYLSLCVRPKRLVLSFANSPRNPPVETECQLPINEWLSENGKCYLIAVSDSQPSREEIEAAIRLKEGWDTGKTMKVIIDGEVVDRPVSHEYNQDSPFGVPIVEDGLIEVTTLNHTMPEFTSFRDEQ